MEEDEELRKPALGDWECVCVLILGVQSTTPVCIKSVYL